MGFLDIAPEVRIQIYTELLVAVEPIRFRADFGPPSPPLLRPQRYGLCPAILRTCRKIHNEAIEFLYSNNVFEFPEVYDADSSIHVQIKPFLDQIGTKSRLFLRHICIPFPDFDFPAPNEPTGFKLEDVRINDLKLIGKETETKTLELLVAADDSAQDLCNVPPLALRLLDEHVRAVPSLKEIIVNFKEYPEEEPDEELTKTMSELGWAIKVTRLPKRVWISDDGRVGFDNEEDCRAYDNEQLQKEFEMEDRREAEMWEEEYYRRRRDPYWKNDSDYD